MCTKTTIAESAKKVCEKYVTTNLYPHLSYLSDDKRYHGSESTSSYGAFIDFIITTDTQENQYQLQKSFTTFSPPKEVGD